MSKVLELQFMNAAGKSATISIDDPNEPVNTATVLAAMDAIIAANVFSSTGGDLTAKLGARVVERTVADVDLGL